MATNGIKAHSELEGAPMSNGETAPVSSSPSNISQDEVGWYFVEQYYTTLSRNPEKLHLFYSKRSQFVYGVEAEAVNIAIGRSAIQERIKELDLEDYKVRISNVDSHSSFDNIVIQAIGETSIRSGEPRKFVQTFILAQQPSGYFVLNDILRYIDDGAFEEKVNGKGSESKNATSQPAEIKTQSEAVSLPAKAEPESESKELDTTVVDEKLQKISSEPAAQVPTAVAAAEAADVEEPEKIAAPAKEVAQPALNPEVASAEIAEEDIKEPEKPQDPVASPVAQPAVEAAATEPEKPKGPPKPMTWASRAAAASGTVRPIVPLPKPAATPALTSAPSSAPSTTAPAQPRAPLASVTNAAAKPIETAATTEDSSEWRTAGAEHKRQARTQSSNAPAAGEREGTMGYVRNVTEKVKDDELRSALASAGELIYFDINRTKNCAFVEYATPAGYQAAVAANPHSVSGESIVVEPRRPKAGAYGGANYSQNRGSMPTRGRGGMEGSRPGSQGGRGAFSGNRGRGNMASRGRGAAQAGAA